MFRRLFPQGEKKTKGKKGKLGTLWTKGLDAHETVKQQSLLEAKRKTKKQAWGMGIISGIAVGIASAVASDPHAGIAPFLFLTMAGGAAWGGWYGLPRRTMKHLHQTPLTTAEIDSLSRTLLGESARSLPERIAVAAAERFNTPLQTADELINAYLTLVAEVIQLEGASARVEDDLRRMLKSLGETMATLPPNPAIPMVDTGRLVAEAEAIFERAKAESDRVIAASLTRQAESLVQQATGAQNAFKIARRTGVLRQELLTQIQTVRSSLPALSRTAVVEGQAGQLGRFAAVADSVADVAREAAALADAQEELAQSYPEAYPYPSVRTTAEEELRQTLRAGG
jgi:hypothetical protein